MSDGRWCFQVVDLCERWDMAKLEYQHGPTLRFLVRYLTMANLDISIMTRLEDALMATRMGEIQRLAQRQCACRRVTVCHLLGVAVHARIFICLWHYNVRWNLSLWRSTRALH